MKLLSRLSALGLGFLAANLVASGQVQVANTGPAGPTSKKAYGKMFLKTSVGSFKILGVNREPAEGRFEVNFTGSLLVTGTPKITIQGDLRKEYERKDKEKVVYHGKGKAIIEGKFWGIQWFGRNLEANWQGFGVARLFGEFDKNLETGSYWYADNPKLVEYWGTNGIQITNPPQRRTTTGPKAVERDQVKPKTPR